MLKHDRPTIKPADWTTVATAQPSLTFNSLVEELEATMKMASMFSETANPVLASGELLQERQIKFILQEYSCFPRTIVSLLSEAMRRAHQLEDNWKDVVSELARNIGEEEGSQTEGKSHYQLLCEGCEQELQLTELDTVRPLFSTLKFLSEMWFAIGPVTCDPIQMLGATYALESSAVPELRIVRRLIELAIKNSRGSAITQGGILDDFMSRHLDEWEPGHREGLLIASEKLIKNDLDLENFKAGFIRVMEAMETWWNELSVEMAGW